MNHKKQILQAQKILQEKREMLYAESLLRSQLATILLILGDKYGFGKKRLSEFLEHLANYTLSYKNDCKVGINTTVEDIENILKDEYKLDMNQVMDSIVQKNKEYL